MTRSTTTLPVSKKNPLNQEIKNALSFIRENHTLSEIEEYFTKAEKVLEEKNSYEYNQTFIPRVLGEAILGGNRLILEHLIGSKHPWCVSVHAKLKNKNK